MTSESKKPRVLFVDDEAPLREHMAKALADEFEMQTFTDGEAALRDIDQRPADLVVSARLMRTAGGIELVRALREHPSSRTIPVLMISSDAADELQLQAIVHGADASLAKPFNEAQLRVRCRALLDANSRRFKAVRPDERGRTLASAADDPLHTHILQSLTEGVSVSTQDGTLVYTNAAEDRMFGYESGELIGMHVSEQNAYAPEENDRIVQTVIQTLRNHGVWNGEWFNKRKDGSTFFTRSSINALEREGERFWVCVRWDISAEKAAYDALAESEERYRAFVANSSEGIWRYELDPPLDLSWSIDDQIQHVYEHGTLAELNDAMARMYGYERAEQLAGAPLAHTLPPGPAAFEYLRSIAACGYRISDVESTEADRNGNLRHFSNTLMPIIKGGKVLRAWGTQRDITDRKSAEDRLRENERRKDEFLAVLAHELRNPLAPIRNGVQILRLRASEDDLAQTTLSMMDRQMTHLVRLVDDLLDVSRITSGRLELKRQAVRVRETIVAAAEATAALLVAEGVELELAASDESIWVNADPNRLTQVFVNLLSNAAKYTDRGGRVTVSLERAGNAALVAVRDNGIGIPAEELPNVFEMFSQVRSHVSRAAGGLGIGLALVRMLVEMHEGDVNAVSAGPGQGSTFTVRLPLIVQPTVADEISEKPKVVRPSRRILVVDDNSDAAASLAALLELGGNEVRTAADGVEAVTTTQQYLPGVIFMDLGMPRMDGFEAARKIRSSPGGDHVLLVAVTGWGQISDRERSKEAGFDLHLVKPVSVEEIERILAQADA